MKELIEINNQLEAFAYSLCKDIDKRNDLVQQTNLLMLESKGKYPKEDTKKVALTAMRNTFINQYRRDIKHKQEDLMNISNYITEDNDLLLLEIINKHISELGGELTTTFRLMCDGYSYQEIADKVKLPVGTIRNRIFKARNILKKQLTSILD